MLLPQVCNGLKKKKQQIGVNGYKVTEEVCRGVLQGSLLEVTKSGDVIKL